MRLVTRPYAKPHHCAALPYVGQGDRTRWIDTGSHLNGPDDHVYLSEIAVREAARLVGMVPVGELHRRNGEIVLLKARVIALEHDRDELRRAWAAVDVIESEGFRTRKKPGRPVKEVA